MADLPVLTGTRRVLVIDDHRDGADSLARFLRAAGGFAVAVAGDGEAGLRAAFAARPDAVVCDLALPRLGGLRVAEELSNVRPKPLLIAVTGFTGAYPEDLALVAGFDHHLQKPADPRAVAALIEGRPRPAGP